uniref:NADH dehydrogenase subunit 5 n=1 Tax=Lamproglena chinensis TaxID=342427 RepID=UPI00286C24C1|nr:NADH dehydrogenase subunit 5 [Lamproglena chinensis]WKF18922.1 NADH dehydrogenase subunit 5 [Lamproglena chinensis]
MIFVYMSLFGVLALGALVAFMAGPQAVFIEWFVMSRCSVGYPFVVLLDMKSLMFVLTVSLISISVFLFSSDYMKNEPAYLNFHFLVFLFVLSMYLLILSPNLISMLIGWDGLGVTSYLLVIYYQNNKTLNAGLLTLMTNRVGDVLILLCIGWLLSMGSWNMFDYTSSWNPWLIILVVAACTKSAQMPFMAWLPAAMAAPTPVSALVHSSTLVTAGVYLVIRHELGLTSGIFTYLVFVGVISTLVASVAALWEKDLKKVVALSTLSQLGVMMVAIGVGSTTVAFAHLIGHAMFKALLFISTGNMIHGVTGYQDVRFMGSTSMEFNKYMVLLSSMSLMGLPFMVAFYTKEVILEKVLLGGISVSLAALFYVTVLITPIYSLRLLMLYYYKLMPGIVLKPSGGVSWANSLSMLILGVPSLFMGVGLDLMVYEAFTLPVYSWLLNFVLFVGVPLWCVVVVSVGKSAYMSGASYLFSSAMVTLLMSSVMATSFVSKGTMMTGKEFCVYIEEGVIPWVFGSVNNFLGVSSEKHMVSPLGSIFYSMGVFLLGGAILFLI